jgi:hypothetical protein
MGPEAQTSGWNQATAQLGARGIQSLIVVPLMVSSYGGHYRQIEFYAGRRDELPVELHAHDAEAPPAIDVPVRVTPALDTAAELLDAVEARWRALEPRSQAAPLVMVAHGPNDEGDAARWTHAMHLVLARLGAAGHRSQALPMLLRDDAPAHVRAAAVAAMRDSITALAARAGDSVTVMTLLIARGQITQRTIPGDLAGLPIRYAPMGLTPLPAIARWIERSAERARQDLEAAAAPAR